MGSKVICKKCVKPIRADESQSIVPEYNKQGKIIGESNYHLGCTPKVKIKESDKN